MAMAFQWHTHPDVSPFVPLGQAIAPQLGALQQRANFPGSMVPQPVSSVGGTSRAPDSMQVDDSGGAPVTGGSRPAASSSAPGPSGTAGPSGVQPGATSDAQMVEGRAPRKHVDAPMRKLSVSLIDTYKLINQVRENPALQHSRRGGGRLRGRCGEGGGTLAGSDESCVTEHSHQRPCHLVSDLHPQHCTGLWLAVCGAVAPAMAAVDAEHHRHDSARGAPPFSSRLTSICLPHSPAQVYYEKRKRRQEEKAASTASTSSGSKKERKGSINNGTLWQSRIARARCHLRAPRSALRVSRDATDPRSHQESPSRRCAMAAATALPCIACST